MRGRKPKPIEQRQREGNPGRRPLPEPLPLPESSLSKPDLPDAASALWDELVPVLEAADVLHRVDQAALEALCMQWERGAVAGRVLKEEGYFALGSMGQVVEHPALGIERQAHTLFLRFAEQYGITPVARARIATARSIVDALDQALGASTGEFDEFAEIVEVWDGGE